MYWHAEIRGAFEAPAAVRVLIYNAYSTPPPTPITTDPFTLLRPTNLARALPRPTRRTLSLSLSLSSFLPRRSFAISNRNAARIALRVRFGDARMEDCFTLLSFRIMQRNKAKWKNVRERLFGEIASRIYGSVPV